MSKRTVVPLRATTDALSTLGAQIRLARHARRWTAADLATKIGVSERTVLALESGAPGTSIGTVFNAAVMAGVPLFGTDDRAELARMRYTGEQQLALIKSRVYHPRRPDTDDDFF